MNLTFLTPVCLAARPKPCADGSFAVLNFLAFAWTLLVPSRPSKDQCELSSRLWKFGCFCVENHVASKNGSYARGSFDFGLNFGRFLECFAIA